MEQYIVDAFTDRVFRGNPAAVCVMDKWLPDALMQKIAVENNLSETAFVVKEGESYHIRWFTPGAEVDLCGHATLASTYVLSRFFEPDADVFRFQSLSGPLTVWKKRDLLELDFPARMPVPVPFTPEMQNAINGLQATAYMDRDVILIFDREEDVVSFCPDPVRIGALPDGMGLYITAASEKYDFVSRCFFPKIQINEDPVCGSAHCSLIPYWSKQLGKNSMTAYECSPRGGILYCQNAGDRVLIAGKAALYSKAEIFVEPSEEPLS